MYVSSLAAWLVDMPVTMVRQVHQTGVADVPLPSRQLSLPKRQEYHEMIMVYNDNCCQIRMQNVCQRRIRVLEYFRSGSLCRRFPQEKGVSLLVINRFLLVFR